MNQNNVNGLPRSLKPWLVPLMVVGVPRYAVLHVLLLVLARVCMGVQPGAWWEPMPAQLFFFCGAAAMASVNIAGYGARGIRWVVLVVGVLGVLFLSL